MIGPPLRKLSIKKFPLIALACSVAGEATGDGLTARAGDVSVAPTVDPGAGGRPAGETPGATGDTPGTGGGICAAGFPGAAGLAGTAVAAGAPGGGGGGGGVWPNAVNASVAEQMETVSNVFIVAAEVSLPARFLVTVSSFIPKDFMLSRAKLFTFYFIPRRSRIYFGLSASVGCRTSKSNRSEAKTFAIRWIDNQPRALLTPFRNSGQSPIRASS